MASYKIHPSIGVARVGNSDEFYLSPEAIGGRPIVCDKFGNEKNPREYVKKFKDKQKMVKKQAAKFRIYKQNPGEPEKEVNLANDPDIKSVKWTVHLANKKAAWYHFADFKGDLMLGKNNTYVPPKEPDSADDQEQDLSGILRNADIKGKQRRELIVDFGPRSLMFANDRMSFRNDKYAGSYPATSPLHQRKGYAHDDKPHPLYGKRVDYLGEIITDSNKNLIALGGNGNSGGDESFDTFAGGESWYDDMSDGPVICEITLNDGNDTKITLDAWVIVGPPKFAPELVNITTLDDVMFDVAVKYFGAATFYNPKKPEWKDNSYWDPEYAPNFERDIEPIIKRIGHYRWVANIPSMTAFSNPSFNPRDKTDKDFIKNASQFFKYFRKAGDTYWGLGGQSDQLFSDANEKNDYLNGIPLMPNNLGSNAVSNTVTDKFVELGRVQYYFLEQWSKGKFTVGKTDKDLLGMLEIDHADVGNCVGSPMCPGVEVTWSVKNPAIYESPYKIKHKNKDKDGNFDLDYYRKNGLNPNWDETAPEGEPGKGCEPGDLTKRMADPWVSDLFECNINHVNFTSPKILIDMDVEAPPTYYGYWWPPQSPWDVILGITDPEMGDPRLREEEIIKELTLAGASAGQPVNYLRGVHNHIELTYAWSYLGFIVNQNNSEDRNEYPYFVEKERNHEEFDVSAVAVANKRNVVDLFGMRLQAGYHLKKDIIEFSEIERRKSRPL